MLIAANLPTGGFGVAQMGFTVAPVRLRIADIIATAEAHCDLERGAFAGRSRDRHIAWPRQALMLALRTARPEMSLPNIGARLGGRDHTTIMHGIRAAKLRCDVDPDFADLVAVFQRLARL